MEPREALDPLRHSDPLSADWITVVLLLVLAALAYTNVNSPRKWRLLVQAMFRMRLGRQTLREEIDLQDRTFIGLLLVAATVIAMFLWQGALIMGPPDPPSFLLLGGAILALLIAQGVLLHSVASLAQQDKGITEYLSTGLLLFILNGLLLLPVVVLIAYRSAWRPFLVLAGIILVALLVLYRWVRGTWVGSSEGVPLRYLILYLCAAEAVPILLLVNAWHPIPLHFTTP